MAKEDYYGWVFSSPHEMLQAIFDSCHFIQGMLYAMKDETICSLLGNVCFSRKLYDEVGGYDESVGMAEDLDLYVRFLINGHLNVYLPIISHLHRMHTANFSIGCDRDKHHSDLKDIYQRNEARLQSMGVKLTLSN